MLTARMEKRGQLLTSPHHLRAPECHVKDTSIIGQLYIGAFSARTSQVPLSALASESMNHHFYLIPLYADQDRYGNA